MLGRFVEHPGVAVELRVSLASPGQMWSQKDIGDSPGHSSTVMGPLPRLMVWGHHVWSPDSSRQLSTFGRKSAIEISNEEEKYV